MSPEEDKVPDSVLVYQVQQLEKQLGIGLRHVDDRLDRLESEMRQRFDALTFVSEKSYLADRAADERVRAAKAQVVDDYAKETRSIAEGARTVAWAVAVLLVGSLAGLLAIIKAVAG